MRGGVKPLPYEKVKDCAYDLHCRGLLNLSRKGLSIVGAPVRDLSKVLSTIKRCEQIGL